MRLWVDTDVGDNPDDAVALLCAAAHPAVELVGVSTTGGRTEWRAELARGLVDVEVVPGEEPDRLAGRLTEAAPDALLAIGPLTNVAALLTVGLTLPVVAMGGTLGSVRHRGRVRHVESNFGADAGAAAVVVERADLTIVPLDVTVAMRLDAPTLALFLAADARLVPEVARWTTAHDDPVVLHDPLALLVVAGESFVETARRRIAVDQYDGAVREVGAGRDQTVVTGVDAAGAIDRILDLLT